MTDEPTLTSAVSAVSRRALSCVELVQQTLERLAATEPLVHAYAHVDVERALSEAETADRLPSARPLHGVPFGVKDVLDVGGFPTECGSRALKGRFAHEDAAAVARLRSAGAIVIGKHRTHEFTCGLDEPATRNPWNLTHYPGGSSAGGGVSVAVGSSLFALGTDAAGSVRIPASATGVVGLKPTYGRIVTSGVVAQATAPSIDTVGILARTVEDAAIVFGVAADADQAGGRPLPDMSRAGDVGVAGMRLGVLDEPDMNDEVRPEVGDAFTEALHTLEALGAQLVRVRIAGVELARQAVFTIFPIELAAAHRELLATRSADYQEGPRHLIQLGLILPAAHALAADRLRSRLASEMAHVFRVERLDALVTPTMPRPTMPLAEFNPTSDLGGLVPFTCPFNLTGQPAISVPAGFSRDGLPIGLQISGRPYDEWTLLRVARAFEDASGGSTPRLPRIPKDNNI